VPCRYLKQRGTIIASRIAASNRARLADFLLTSQQASAAFLPFHVSATSLPPSSFPLLPHERCQHDSHKAGKQNRMAALKSYHRYDN